jgi:lambda family phage portal protein
MTDKKPTFAAANLLDRAIAVVSPKLAADRLMQRTKFAMMGGYTGAKVDRASLSRYRPTSGSATTDIIGDLPMLRARSRDQMRNAPVALGALNTATSQVIGTGLSFTPAIDTDYLGLDDEQAAAWQQDAKRRFDAWAISTDCDIGRRLNFYGLQELTFRSMLESGDVFVLTPRVERASAEARLALQLIEADRVCNPDRKPDTDNLIDGIELSGNTGEALAVHVARQHPGDRRVTNLKWDRVGVRGEKTGRMNVIHLFKPLRPGQVRGVPWIAPIIEPLKQLSRWTDAELNAAVVSGLFSVFVKMDPDAFQDLFDSDAQTGIIQNAGQWSGEMDSGKAINLLPGESIETSTPGRPNPEFDPFWTAMVRQIGMALEVPFEVLVMHFQSSYSAARGALLMAWRTWRSRRDFMSTYLCQPVYELWLADEIASGRIRAPGFFADPITRAAWSRGFWTGDGPGSIDPVKEVQAAEKRVAMGISTKEAESILHDGIGWEQKHRQRVKEVQAEKRDGIYVLPPGSVPTEKTESLNNEE